MAIINTPQTVTVSNFLDTSDIIYSDKTLSGYIYSDDSWLESTKRKCIVFIADYSSLIRNRTPYEALAQAVVTKGYFFYLGFNFNQDTSSKISLALTNTSTSATSYSSQAAITALATRSHITRIVAQIGTRLPDDKDLILVSDYNGGLGLLEWSRAATGQTGLVKNIVTLALSAGQTSTGSVNELIHNSYIVQMLHSKKHPVLAMYSNDDILANVDYARKLRYQMALSNSVIFVSLGNKGNSWTKASEASWVDLAIMHSEDTTKITIGDEEEEEDLVVYLPGV